MIKFIPKSSIRNNDDITEVGLSPFETSIKSVDPAHIIISSAGGSQINQTLSNGERLALFESPRNRKRSILRGAIQIFTWHFWKHLPNYLFDRISKGNNFFVSTPFLKIHIT